MSKTKVVFRADGNSEIGLGHVIRSLALADMLKEDFDCVFAIQEPDEILHNQIREICQDIIQLPICPASNSCYVKELDNYLHGNEIVVLDGYKFITDYQQHIKVKGCVLVCIDDIHAYHFVADVIINHAGGIKENDYSLEPYTQCYLGVQYSLLRSPFLVKNKRDMAIYSLKKLFINMGGADPLNDTCKVIKDVSAYTYFDEIHIITGISYKHIEELNKLVGQDQRMKHHSSLDASEMAELMQKCGTAICPPSSVALEYASIGGLLFLKQIADNQIAIKKYFIQQQLALEYDTEFSKIKDPAIYTISKSLAEKQREVLDGKSDERLKNIFIKLGLAMQISFRRATEEDLMKCFEWANDPEVRQSSFNSNPINLEEHTGWFNKKIKDANSRFYIVESNAEPIGQIRFEGVEEKIISYLIAAEMRGKGLGYIILSKGVKELLKENKNVRKISGYVKASNIASCKAFEKAGFQKNVLTVGANAGSLKYELIIQP